MSNPTNLPCPEGCDHGRIDTYESGPRADGGACRETECTTCKGTGARPCDNLCGRPATPGHDDGASFLCAECDRQAAIEFSAALLGGLSAGYELQARLNVANDDEPPPVYPAPPGSDGWAELLRAAIKCPVTEVR